MSDRAKSNLFEGTKLSNLFQSLTLIFILLGTVIRLIQYSHNRSLWFDEVNLALNIVNRSYSELAQTLDHNQAAPLGFLWIEKLATQVLGNNEYALRFFPLISSIVALGVFYCLVSRYCSPLAVTIAIAIFAFGRHTLYFATELKQYSSDIAIALILFWVLTNLGQKILNNQVVIFTALLGSLVIWFSHPSIFILGGLESYYLLTASRKIRLTIFLNRLTIYLSWLISFGLFYWLTIANTINNEDLASSWSSRYPSSLIDLGWLLDALGRFFYNPMGFTGITDGIGIFAFIFGCVAWYKKDKAYFGALVAPFLATLIAAYLHQYPFRERLIVFLVPLAIIIVAEGTAWLVSQFTIAQGSSKKKILGLILGSICLVGLTIPQITRAGSFVFTPELKHEIRPVTEYVFSQRQPEDLIYVYSLGAQGFSYYAQRLGYSDKDYILGSGNLTHKDKETVQNWQELQTDIQPLQGKPRVWFVLRAEEPETKEILEYLNQIGQEKDSFNKYPGASAYLYNLDM